MRESVRFKARRLVDAFNGFFGRVISSLYFHLLTGVRPLTQDYADALVDTVFDEADPPPAAR